MVPSPGAGDVIIRPGTVEDAETAASLHTVEIREGFLSSLGPRFLAYLYRRLALSPDSFLLIAETDGRPVGFLAGTENVATLYRRFLVHDGVAAALTSAPRLIRAIPRVLETLRHGSHPGDASTQAELLSIAVDGSARRSGAGRLLVSAFLVEMRRRDVPAADVVVAKDNLGAIRLYQSQGFKTAVEFENHPGTVSLLMRWEAQPSDSGGPDAA